MILGSTAQFHRAFVCMFDYCAMNVGVYTMQNTNRIRCGVHLDFPNFIRFLLLGAEEPRVYVLWMDETCICFDLQ